VRPRGGGGRLAALIAAGARLGTVINQGKLSIELKTRAAGNRWSINEDIYLKSALFAVGDWVGDESCPLSLDFPDDCCSGVLSDCALAPLGGASLQSGSIPSVVLVGRTVMGET
jgi:hypothetical protein